MATQNVLWLDYGKPGLVVACVQANGTVWNNTTLTWEPFPPAGVLGSDYLLVPRPFFVGGPQFGATAGLSICEVPDVVAALDGTVYLILAPNWDGTLGRMGIRLAGDLSGPG